MSASIIHWNFCFAIMIAFVVSSGWTKDHMLTTSADSFFMKKSGWSSTDKHVYSFHFIGLLLQVRVKIVTSPWVAGVFEICGPLSLPFDIFIFSAKLMTEQAQHVVTSRVDGLLVETSRPYLNVHSDWNVLTLPHGFGMVYECS